MIDAITNCSNKKAIAKYGKVHPNKAIEVSLTSETFKNYTMLYDKDWNIYRLCESKYQRFECNSVSHYTSFEREPIRVSNDIRIVVKTDSPSFIIQSKPRINHIDYITYVFGALGTWIGFSFLTINPIPYLMKLNPASTATVTSNKDEDIDQKFVDIKNDVIDMKTGLINQINQNQIDSNKKLANCIQRMERKINQIVDAINK